MSYSMVSNRHSHDGSREIYVRLARPDLRFATFKVGTLYPNTGPTNQAQLFPAAASIHLHGMEPHFFRTYMEALTFALNLA